MTRTAFLTLILAVAGAGPGDAQVCAATASFRRFPFRVDGVAAVGDSVTFVSTALFAGSGGAFGSAAAGAARSDGLRDWALTARVGGGYQVSLDTRLHLQVCPMADVSFVFGPDSLYGSDVSHREMGLVFGIAVGSVLVRRRELSVAGSVSAMAVRASRTFEDGFGNSEVLRGTSGLLAFAVGVSLGGALTLRPSLSVPLAGAHAFAPIGVKDRSTRWAITAGIGFGPAPRAAR